jgi:hypothetical protein
MVKTWRVAVSITGVSWDVELAPSRRPAPGVNAIKVTTVGTAIPGRKWVPVPGRMEFGFWNLEFPAHSAGGGAPEVIRTPGLLISAGGGLYPAERKPSSTNTNKVLISSRPLPVFK